MARQHTRDTRSAGNGRRRKVLALLALTLVLGGLGYGAEWLFYGRWHVSTDDAYVHGHVVTVTPQVGGTVVGVYTDDTDYVKKGQILVRLDPADARSALTRAEAALAQTVRHVRTLYAKRASLEARVAAQHVALVRDRRDYERNKALRKVRGVSTEAFQHSASAWRAARATLAATRADLKAARAAVEGTTLASHPLVREAEARVRDAWLALARTRIVAPVAGHVAHRNVQLGERVRPGQSLLALVPLHRVWVDANFKETELAHVHAGQPVTLTSDLYGGTVHYHGRVVGLEAGTGSTFALLPPQNATGNWIKVVQRLPVRIALDTKQLAAHPLRLGLSMSVTVDTHDRSGPALSRAPAGDGSATDAYAAESDGVEALIRRIVRENAGRDAAPAVARR